MENNHYLCNVKLKEINSMSKKMTKLGSVNPCALLYLYNKDNEEIGTCLDTPNNFAVACMLNNNVQYGKAYYQFFGETIKQRKDKDISGRISIYQKLVNLEDKDTLEEINRHKLNINFL